MRNLYFSLNFLSRESIGFFFVVVLFFSTNGTISSEFKVLTLSWKEFEDETERLRN